jgi:hypothetical protein
MKDKGSVWGWKEWGGGMVCTESGNTGRGMIISEMCVGKRGGYRYKVANFIVATV